MSLNPPLVLWSLSGGSSSREAFERCDRYVVNVLSAHQIALARRFATGRTPDRFNGLTVARAPGGTPMLDGGCAAWFECHNRSRYVEGDHVIMVGEVERCGQRRAAAGLPCRRLRPHPAGAHAARKTP